MPKRMSLLLASTITVVGLAAGATPAHAAPSSEAAVGGAYSRLGLRGLNFSLQSQANCEPIDFAGDPAFSASNTSSSSTITLYRNASTFGICFDQAAVLGPGQRDTGYISETSVGKTYLGSRGAYFYSST